MPQVNYELIPEATMSSLQMYLEYGVNPGRFLTAVLENNLREAMGQADEDDLESLFHLVVYLYNEVSADAWGNRERVRAYQDSRRIAVLEREV